jgi:hypothetical protein
MTGIETGIIADVPTAYVYAATGDHLTALHIG